MASRMFNDMQALAKEVKTIAGRVPLNASAAVGTVIGVGFSVAKTSTGLYRITLQDKYVKLLSAQVSVEEAAASAIVAKIQDHDVDAATPYIDFVTVDANTGNLTDTSAAIEVHFAALLKNTTAGE